MALPIVMILGIIVVVAAVVVGGALLLTGQHSTNGGNGNHPSTGTNNNGTQSSTNTSKSNTNSSTGTNNNSTVGGGQVVLSDSQFSSLLGAGGKYNSSSDLTTQQEAAFLHAYAGANGSAWIFNNVSGVYYAAYNFSKGNSSAFGLELVFQTTNGGQAFFNQLLSNSSTSHTQLSTTDGLSYNYTGVNQYYSMSMLEGYKGNYVVIFYSFGADATNPPLAADIAGDLP